MAHTILGVDLGAHAVKVAVMDAGFKRTRLLAVHERRLPPPPPPVAGEPEEPWLRRAARAFAALLAEQGLDSELTFVALPGDQAIFRLLSFPFADAKQIAQTVSYEFEGLIPYDLADLVFDHEILARAEANATTGAATGAATAAGAGSAAPSPGGTDAGGAPVAGVARAPAAQVLCAGARREAARELLAAMEESGVDPRAVTVAPLAYDPLARHLFADGSVRLLVDVGHTRTNAVALREGRHLFARTLSHGGFAITRAVAQALGAAEPEAERYKHEQVHLARPSERAASVRPGPGTRAAAVEAARVAALALARDLRQTLAAVVAACGQPVVEVVLCGGGALLGGLPELLAEELDVPVTPLSIELPLELDPEGVARDAGARCAQAVGLVLGGAQGRLPIDLRKGELAFRSDFSFLRAKAGLLATCGLAILACMAINAFAALHELRKEQRILDQRFAQAAAQIFPGRKLDPEQILAMIQPGGKVGALPEGEHALPRQSAAALLDAVSKAIPTSDRLKLDVTHLSIQPKSMSMKGTIDTASNVDTLMGALKTALPCIDSIASGTITDAPAGGKEFDLTITHHCE